MERTNNLAATYDIVPEADMTGSVSIELSRFVPPASNIDPELLDGQPAWQGLCILALVRSTLAECVEYSVRSINQNFPDHTSFGFYHNELAGLVLPSGNMMTYNRGPFFLDIRYSSTSVEVVAEEEPICNRAVTR